MRRKTRIKKEKEIIGSLAQYYRKNKYKDSDLKDLTDNFEKIFELELKDIGVKYNRKNSSRQNDAVIKFIKDPEKMNANGSFSVLRGVVRDKPVEGKKTFKINISKLQSRLKSKDSKIRAEALKTTVKTILHECQHCRQDMLTQQEFGSKESLIFARDFVLANYLERGFYKSEIIKGNYDNIYIEKDAQEVANSKLLEISPDYKHSLSSKSIEEKKAEQNLKKMFAKYNGNFTSKRGDAVYYSDGSANRDRFSIEIVDDLICKQKRTEYLKIYPVLLKEYNMDGTKKSPLELIENMDKEEAKIKKNYILKPSEKKKLLKDNRDMYSELIYNQLERSKGPEQTAMFKKLGKEKTIELFSKMTASFISDKEEKLKTIDDYTKIQEGKRDLNFESNSDEVDRKIKFLKRKEVEVNVLHKNKIKNLNTIFGIREESVKDSRQKGENRAAVTDAKVKITLSSIKDFINKSNLTQTEIDRVNRSTSMYKEDKTNEKTYR